MLDERWLILGVLFLARTAMAFQFQAVAAVSSFLVADLGIDYTKLGLLIGLYFLPGIAVAYPGGMLGHYFGDKPDSALALCLCQPHPRWRSTGERQLQGRDLPKFG